jgi:hypothetical protein
MCEEFARVRQACGSFALLRRSICHTARMPISQRHLKAVNLQPGVSLIGSARTSTPQPFLYTAGGFLVGAALTGVVSLLTWKYLGRWFIYSAAIPIVTTGAATKFEQAKSGLVPPFPIPLSSAAIVTSTDLDIYGFGSRGLKCQVGRIPLASIVSITDIGRNKLEFDLLSGHTFRLKVKERTTLALAIRAGAAEMNRHRAMQPAVVPGGSYGMSRASVIPPPLPPPPPPMSRPVGVS